MNIFLDLDGLTYLWSKIKVLLNTKANKSEVTQLANTVNNIDSFEALTNAEIDNLTK